jgi:putative glutamine amidotransferase
MPSPLRIGVASCFFHADPKRPIFKGKTLLYLEESLAHWLMTGGAVPLLLPTPSAGIQADDLLVGVDGLVLQGGTDVAPETYGETAIRPEWAGDRVRDRYETDLVRAAVALDRPVLGVCRGLQMLNVIFEGTLLQDISTQCPGALTHREFERYDQLQHDIAIEPDSWMGRMYSGQARGRVNTVHHQGIKELGPGLQVEARSLPDGLIEAVRYQPTPGELNAPWIYAVQWHPEFQDPADRSLLPTAPLRDCFLEAVNERRRRRVVGDGSAPC